MDRILSIFNRFVKTGGNLYRFGCSAAGLFDLCRPIEEFDLARPSKPLISRQSAAEAALEVIDEHGLDDLSLGLVAQRIGVRTPSLYHHFRDKSELLEEVVRIMLLRLPTLKSSGSSYEERVIALCVATRRALLRHPNAARLILQYFPKHIMLAAYERAAAEKPYPTEIHMTVLEAVEKYTFGGALFEAAAQARGIQAMPPVDKVKYPALAKALDDNPFDDEELFIEALRILLLGVQTRIKSGMIGQPLG